MKIELKNSLIQVIEKWIIKHCEDYDWPDCYIHDDLADDMASAAEMVFDANEKGQKVSKES